MTTHETAPAMRVPIGESVSCTLVRVLDERLVPCPEGEPGEIYLAGPALARGYLDRPEQTAERFLADPHGPPGSRMYRTGDLGMWGDGGLVHCGRADEQVKVRGFRVEPGELAAALEEIEGVREASALAAPGVEGPVLVAVVCGERAPADGELMAALRERLPGHMLPQRVLRLPRLPRTPVGKIDLQALRRAARAAGPTEPRAADGEPDGADEATSRVCALMAEVLGRPVRPGDDFFALGGHSLTALRLTALLEAQTGAPVPLRLLFDAPEPAALARRLAREGEGPAPAADGARAAEPEGAEPGGGPGQDAPSPAQERMLLLQDLAGGTAYTIPMHWRLRAPGLDPELLERAWRLLFRRHATLRCCYPRAGRGRRRRELDPAEVEIRTLRLPEEGAEDRTAALERTLRTVAREPFDLEREAPARLVVVPDERDGGAFDLGLFVHHAAADEHGLELLQRELTELLDALLSGRAAEAPPPPRSAAAVAAAQRRRLRERRDAELAAWRERLAGHAGSGELPADAHSGSGAGVAVCELPGLGPRELAAAARRLRLTPFMLSHAAVALALQRAGAGEDLVLASPVAGRQEPGAEALVDCATNTVPVRHRRIDEGTIADFAERTREAVLDALERQTVPFDEVQRACGGSSLSEVLVSSYHAERARTRSGPVECLSRPLPAEEAKAALSCTLVVGARAAENGPGAEP
ncbi:MAG: condensation domain-containing protein, partial [Pseudoclavibacter sp.]|nr:condensation domain-containing protein [Pseudoclavibacter sp.]